MILFSLLEFCDTSSTSFSWHFICLFFLSFNLWLLLFLFQSFQNASLALVWCLVPCVVASKLQKCGKASVLMENSGSLFYIWESCFMQLSKLFRIIWNRKGIVKLGYFSRPDAKLPILTSVVTRSDWNAAARSVITVTSDTGILRQAKRKIHNTRNSSH